MVDDWSIQKVQHEHATVASSPLYIEGESSDAREIDVASNNQDLLGIII